MPKKTHTVVVGPFLVNCYLFWDTDTREGVIIDPGADEEAIEYQIDQFDIEPRAILLTHGHGDHIAAVAPLKEKYDLPLYIGAGEEGLLASPSANVSAFFDKPIVAPAPDFTVTDEQLLSVGGVKLRVLSTPGHTPAGVCFLEEEEGLLFCGDTLFAGSIGRTDFPGSSHVQLLESIQKQILNLPDSVVCLPGHGPRTTVGAERTSNPFLSGGQYA
ncbi:MAG: MBL fold metallo-hydrolase [bacterium]|nr:MBL fold metallo-hydrolase [bacterium]